MNSKNATRRVPRSPRFKRVFAGVGVIAVMSWCGMVSLANSQDELAGASVSDAIHAVRSIGPEGAGFNDAGRAAERLRTLPGTRVFEVYEAMQDAGPVAQNWLRGIAGDIVRGSQPPTVVAIESYVLDESNSDVGRSTAMGLLRQLDSDRFDELLPGRLDDPSLLIREMAVAAKVKEFDGGKDSSIATVDEVRRVLESARHPVQVSNLIKKLDSMGETVTTADAFSMIRQWRAIGPFDNRGGIGFDEAYAPEAKFEATGRVDLAATYDGKNGPVSWMALEAKGDDGKVDLAAAYDKEKGAAAYVYTEFESAIAADAQARLGCICASQAWVNGKQVMSNEVYHSGTRIDQYVADIQLLSGTNRILLKICQNEQTQSWAQEWEFQFRVTDPTGKGLQSRVE
ncbi:hypothetical protein FHS27_001041 [Rhodopirellula rubra]|uniref:Uncharacterized protein n=1 Tax=Aporhodopirellula rubra TaxID=980271 RepID=A0A7W5DVG0_9BACT|nr:hypothetical protein [Aporhodopirellula rubra]MBB3205241.1 hypothetical protein [Aporhodopirellula rubra]